MNVVGWIKVDKKQEGPESERVLERYLKVYCLSRCSPMIPPTENLKFESPRKCHSIRQRECCASERPTLDNRMISSTWLQKCRDEGRRI